MINFRPVLENLDLVVGSFLTTLALFVVTFALSLLPALLVALGRVYGPPPLRGVLVAFTYVVRGVPGVLVVLVIYFAMPFVGLTLGSFESVVMTLAAIQTVYVSEVFRAALLAVDRGQFEAASSLGLGRWATFREVIIPQAAVVAAPAFMSSVIQLMQNTTIASGVGLYDLLGRAQNLAVNYLDGSPILIVAPIYILVLLPLVRYGRRLEARRLAATQP
jgi:polar amino acid transport system permease protein